MAKYAVFVGVLPVYATERYHALLDGFERLKNRSIIGEARMTINNVAKPKGLGFTFPEDKKIQSVVSEMDTPALYGVIRAEVFDRRKLTREARRFCTKYGLDYRIYEE